MKNTLRNIFIVCILLIGYSTKNYAQSDNDVFFEEINAHLYANDLDIAKSKIDKYYLNTTTPEKQLFGNILLSQYYGAKNMEDSVGISMAKAEELSRKLDNELTHGLYQYDSALLMLKQL